MKAITLLSEKKGGGVQKEETKVQRENEVQKKKIVQSSEREVRFYHYIFIVRKKNNKSIRKNIYISFKDFYFCQLKMVEVANFIIIYLFIGGVEGI